MVRRSYFPRAHEREKEELNNISERVEEDASHNNHIKPVDKTTVTTIAIRAQ